MVLSFIYNFIDINQLLNILGTRSVIPLSKVSQLCVFGKTKKYNSVNFLYKIIFCPRS